MKTNTLTVTFHYWKGTDAGNFVETHGSLASANLTGNPHPEIRVKQFELTDAQRQRILALTDEMTAAIRAIVDAS